MGLIFCIGYLNSRPTSSAKDLIISCLASKISPAKCSVSLLNICSVEERGTVATMLKGESIQYLPLQIAVCLSTVVGLYSQLEH